MTFSRLVQTALNRYLSLDPESVNRIHALRGKIIKIQLTLFPPVIFFLQFNEHSVSVLTDFSLQPDLVIKGTPLSLFGMSQTKDKRSHFFDENVVLEGNLEIGQQVTDLLDQVEIDWEEYLSHWIGDVPAYHIGRIAKRIKNVGQRLRKNMLQNVNDYIHEEIHLFPPEEELQDFFHDIDQLRLDVDRMEARINQLTRGDE